MRGVLPNNGNNSVETINAAARAIVSAERRVQQPTVQKRRWVGCLSVYWCFGSHRHGSRIGHAVILPDASSENSASTGNAVPAGDGQGHVPMPPLPFIAPPSSPASFLQSEPPTAAQSPGGLLSLCSLSSNVYSPVGHSIFAIGPYAHETQLVSPPVFSTFTTEPSTAPFTPPPESVHVTTPSSPEVPFAKLVSSALDAKRKNDKASTFPLSFAPLQYSEFQAYQLYPGSPIGHLISPSSAISGSGTSSPFPDIEFSSNSFPVSASAVLSQVYDPPKLCSANAHTNTEKSAGREHPNSSFSELRAHILLNAKANDCSQDGAVFVKRIPQLVATGDVAGGFVDEQLVDHRVSFALCTPEVSCKAADRGDGEGCMPESPVLMAVSRRLSSESNASKLDLWLEKPRGRLEDHCSAAENSGTVSAGVVTSDRAADDASDGSPHLVESVDLSVSKEFKFDNADGAIGPATITSSEWWANEKLGAKAGSKNWAFFPMMQPGFS
ncbi:uncharacterized protein LOC116253088 [Nymphaea colorata]|nr:uncharacterized protein LOC116253088 [Nymphaea colorata]